MLVDININFGNALLFKLTRNLSILKRDSSNHFPNVKAVLYVSTEKIYIMLYLVWTYDTHEIGLKFCLGGLRLYITDDSRKHLKFWKWPFFLFFFSWPLNNTSQELWGSTTAFYSVVNPRSSASSKDHFSALSLEFWSSCFHSPVTVTQIPFNFKWPWEWRFLIGWDTIWYFYVNKSWIETLSLSLS